MRILNRRDVVSALATGLTTGVILWLVLASRSRTLPFGLNPALLIVALPLCWAVGVQLGYLLGSVVRAFTQFGRFACIGFANFAVDLGVLTLEIVSTGISSGPLFPLFKAFSFFVASVHSYFWNKYWAFDAGGRGGSVEVARFSGVALASAGVNVAIATVVIMFRPAGVPGTDWAQLASVIASASALVFSFVGFRVFVFKRK